jgi:hypothetical protein
VAGLVLFLGLADHSLNVSVLVVINQWTDTDRQTDKNEEVFTVFKG